MEAMQLLSIGACSVRLPGSLLMSQLSCFLEMLVQLRSRAAGCLLMMPLSIRGVMDLQRCRLMCFQSLLSQHLVADADTHTHSFR